MFKKTKIAAVTSAVLGLSSLVIAPGAQAVSVAESGAAGQVLVFPYYNVNNGFSTSFNITNTTNTYKAVKMRFRESNTSNDVLDFNVYMSPFDVFTVGLSMTADGGVLLTTSDNTCTLPAIPAGGVAFRDVYDSVENADMREGYLEVIEMGVIDEVAELADGRGIAAGIKHDTSGANAGYPADCSVVNQAWMESLFVQGGAASNTTPIDIVNPVAIGYPNDAAMNGQTVSAVAFYGLEPGALAGGVYQADASTAAALVGETPVIEGVALAGAEASLGILFAPTGGLIGSEVLIDTVNVAGFVAEPITFANYTATPQHYLSSDQNFYLLPSLASGDSVVASNYDEATQLLVPTTWGTVARDFGLDDVNVLPRTSVPSGINPMPMAHAMAVTSLSNQFFLAGETSTDWVVAAPMRKHGIFNNYQYAAAGNASYSEASGDIAIAGDDAANGYWDKLNGSDVSAEFVYYNREEDKDQAAPGDFSPPSVTDPTAITLDREVNILALQVSGSTNPSVLGSSQLTVTNVKVATGFDLGWGSFDFSSYDLIGGRYYGGAGDLATPWVTGATPAAALGVPLHGFAAARGAVNGQNLGESFPMAVGRTR